MKKNIRFIKNYLSDFSDLIKPNNEIANKLVKVKNIFLTTSKKKVRF
jgi:hypothetical protein